MNKEKCWFIPICKDKSKCEECATFYKMNSLCDTAMLEGKLRELRPLKLDNDSMKKFQNMKSNLRSIVLHGGNGSSSEVAKRLLLNYFASNIDSLELGCRGLFFNTHYHMTKYNKFDVEKEWIKYIDDNIINCDVLVLDNFDLTILNKFQNGYLKMAVQRRLEVGMTTIIVAKTPIKTHSDWLFLKNYCDFIELKEEN